MSASPNPNASRPLPPSGTRSLITKVPLAPPKSPVTPSAVKSVVLKSTPKTTPNSSPNSSPAVPRALPTLQTSAAQTSSSAPSIASLSAAASSSSPSMSLGSSPAKTSAAPAKGSLARQASGRSQSMYVQGGIPGLSTAPVATSSSLVSASSPLPALKPTNMALKSPSQGTSSPSMLEGGQTSSIRAAAKQGLSAGGSASTNNVPATISSNHPDSPQVGKMLLDADFERRLEEQIEKRKELEKKIDDEKMVRLQMIASLKNMEVELGEKLSWMNVGDTKKGAMASVRGLFRKGGGDKKRTSFYSLTPGKSPLDEDSSKSFFAPPPTPTIENKVFGVPLAKMLEGGHFLPKIVKEAMDHLKRNHLNERDLFIKDPSSSDALLTLADSIERTGTANFAEIKEPHLVAAIIKEFFDKLPEPLLTYKLYDDLVIVEDILNQALRTSMLHSLIFSMPTEHVMLLRALMAFLQQLCANSSVNGLNAITLGSVFGPLIMKRAEGANDQGKSENTPRLVVGSLIKEYQKIFLGDEKEMKYVMKNNQQLVEAGTVDKLVEKLLDEYYQDTNYVDAFILVHRYFLKSHELVEKLAKMFQTDYPTVSRKNVWDVRIQKRILEVMKKLIDTQAEDMIANKEFMSSLSKFLANGKQRAANNEVLYNHISNFVKNSRADKKPAPEWFYPTDRTITKPDSNILHFPVAEIAQQMTILDQTLFKLIPAKEFLFKAHTKPETSPKFTKMVDRFNMWGNWVSSEIVKRKDLDKRVELVSWFIKLAAECLAIQNFNSCTAIVGGLNSFAVTRLKITMEKIPKKDLKTLAKMQELFSMEKNHKTYRETLKTSKPPFVPYLALYAKDLFGLEENTNNFTDAGLVNFAKMRKLYNTVKTIQTYQSFMYSQLKINPHIQEAFNQFKIVPDSELSTLSQECEARKQA